MTTDKKSIFFCFWAWQIMRARDWVVCAHCATKDVLGDSIQNLNAWVLSTRAVFPQLYLQRKLVRFQKHHEMQKNAFPIRPHSTVASFFCSRHQFVLFSARLAAKPKWRHCYDCLYVISEGKEIGDKECADSFQSDPKSLNVVNCTGYCVVSASVRTLSFGGIRAQIALGSLDENQVDTKKGNQRISECIRFWKWEETRFSLLSCCSRFLLQKSTKSQIISKRSTCLVLTGMNPNKNICCWMNLYSSRQFISERVFSTWRRQLLNEENLWFCLWGTEHLWTASDFLLWG